MQNLNRLPYGIGDGDGIIVGVGVGDAPDAVGLAVGAAVGVGEGVPLRDGVDHSMLSSFDVPDSITVTDRVDVPTDNVGTGIGVPLITITTFGVGDGVG